MIGLTSVVEVGDPPGSAHCGDDGVEEFAPFAFPEADVPFEPETCGVEDIFTAVPPTPVPTFGVVLIEGTFAAAAPPLVNCHWQLAVPVALADGIAIEFPIAVTAPVPVITD